MKKFLPPIKKTQIMAEPESAKGKVNFILETGDNLITTETKRPLLAQIDIDKIRPFEEEIKGSSPKKKILMNWKDPKTPLIEGEIVNELDFDEGLFLLQKTFNLKTMDILQNLKVVMRNFNFVY
jgi:hypothetical protein